MPDCWAVTWSVTNDVEQGLTVTWTDDAGEHTSTIHAPSAGLDACDARTITPALHDLMCGRRTGQDGCHVSIDHWRKLGSVAD